MYMGRADQWKSGRVEEWKNFTWGVPMNLIGTPHVTWGVPMNRFIGNPHVHAYRQTHKGGGKVEEWKSGRIYMGTADELVHRQSLCNMETADE